MKKIVSLFVFLLITSIVLAQEEIAKADTSVESKKFIDVFRNGNYGGHIRYAYFHSNNTEGLSDAHALGIGMGIDFETAKFKGFQFGMSGFFIYNLHSSDLSALDPLSNQPNRYEIGLFDVENPKNKHDLDRLEELYLKYQFKKSFLKIGKQHFNSPFINPQDGRMRPTIVQGIHLEINEFKKLKVQLSYLNSISPRSTIQWFGIGESIGIYPVGVNSTGKASKYKGNVKSDYVVMVDAQYALHKNLKVQAHNLFVDNIMNSSLLELDYTIPIINSYSLNTSAQWIHQEMQGNGGNDSVLKSYYENQDRANVLSARLGVRNKRSKIYLNYTHIFKDGKYLMPREWGRDPFYTFMPRERNEGFADLQALNISYKRNWFENKMVSGITFGFYDLPDVQEYAKNKYGMPDYSQLNIDLKYHFKKYFEGLSIDVLYVHKFNRGNTYNNVKYIYNKVDLTLFNIFINYNF